MKLKDNFYTIENATHDADKHVFGVLLNPNHAIYAAHFPGNPITPGACTLQMVGELAEEVVGKPLQLSCAKNVKYLAPLTPTDTPFRPEHTMRRQHLASESRGEKQRTRVCQTVFGV